MQHFASFLDFFLQNMGWRPGYGAQKSLGQLRLDGEFPGPSFENTLHKPLP
jgi:hypothetical protein